MYMTSSFIKQNGISKMELLQQQWKDVAPYSLI